MPQGSGSALAGAVIAAGIGITHYALSYESPALHPAIQLTAAASQFAANFELVYEVPALICAIAFVATLFMPNTLLRSKASPPPLGEQAH